MGGSLIQRLVFVTGGSRGIGRAIAEACAREGAAAVAVSCFRTAETGEVARAVESFGARFLSVEMDVTVPEQVQRAIDTITHQFGGLDVLVNNAGVYQAAPFLEISPEEWRRVFDINTHGPFFCCRFALPALQDSKRGAIINIASTAGKHGSRYQAAYNASKHGLLGMTKCLALEYASTGLTVNAICPGFVETDILSQARSDWSKLGASTPEQVQAQFVSRVPQGRVLRADEVAAMAVFLASDGARGITG